jgi:hypothetical protein
MTTPFLMACLVLGAISAFLFFFSMSFFYSRPAPTPEVESPELEYKPRWGAIVTSVGLSGIVAVVAVCVFLFLFLPARKVEEAEEIAHETFAKKVGRTPKKLQFVDTDPRGHFGKLLVAGWQLKGMAWLENGEVWDVTVTRVTHERATDLECVIVPREAPE